MGLKRALTRCILIVACSHNMIEEHLLAFLREFSRLAPTHQRVFLWCLEHRPFPRPFTGDFGDIAIATGLHRNTVRYALRSISRHPVLSATVHVVNINPLEEFYAQTQEQAGPESDPADIE